MILKEAASHFNNKCIHEIKPAFFHIFQAHETAHTLQVSCCQLRGRRSDLDFAHPTRTLTRFLKNGHRKYMSACATLLTSFVFCA
jgi:hypothetical protein